MPLEDEIISERNEGSGMRHFLDSAQSAIAGAVAQGAAEKLVDGMFSADHNRKNQSGEPGLYPNLHEGEKPNTFMDTAQTAFADAFAKRTAEKLVDGIIPDNRQSRDQPQTHEKSGFDLGSLGSSLLESLSDQVLHPSNNDRRHQQEQVTHENQPGGFDFGKVGSGILGSLAEQVLHPADKRQEEHHQRSSEGNQGGFDLGKVGSELLGSLTEQVLHPSDKKEHSQQQSSNPNNQSGDLGSIIGSLAENVLGGNKPHHQTQNQAAAPGGHPQKFADTAGNVAASLFESLADSVLKTNNGDRQEQQYGYGPPPENYGPSGNYGPPQEGYGQVPEGIEPDPRYRQGPQNYAPPGDYQPQGQPRQQAQSGGDIGSFLLHTLSDAVKPNHSTPQRDSHHSRREDQDSTPDIGSFLVNSLASKMLQPHHQQ